MDAVILNSGGANACTGPQGFQNTHTTAEKTAEVLGISATDVFVCSTGLIGEQLPMDKIVPGIDAAAAALSADGGAEAATAIMTTDTVPKQAVFTGTDAEGNGFTIGGIAKGAGMLAPGLATMLVVLTTDADVPAGNARRRPPRCHARHLRPGGLGRLHVHQRHRGAAGLRAPPVPCRPPRRSARDSPRCAPNWPAS